MPSLRPDGDPEQADQEDGLEDKEEDPLGVLTDNKRKRTSRLQAGLNDGNPGTQQQRVLMLMKIMEIYELEGAAEKISFYIHGRGHSVAHESRSLMFDFLDAHLKPPEVIISILKWYKLVEE